MDVKITDISDKYDAITKLIDKNGFCNGFLSKSLVSEKIHKELFLTVEDKDVKKRGERFELAEALRGLLQCEVVVSRVKNIYPWLWQFWNDTNRVYLKDNPSEQDKKSFSASLEKIFGEKWVFAPLCEPERYKKIEDRSLEPTENNDKTYP